MNPANRGSGQGVPSAAENLFNTRWRVALWLTLFMVVVYFGFLLFVAFDKPLMGTPLFPGLSLGLLLGVGVILVVWILTYVYVSWANSSFDRHLHALRTGMSNSDSQGGRS